MLTCVTVTIINNLQLRIRVAKQCRWGYVNRESLIIPKEFKRVHISTRYKHATGQKCLACFRCYILIDPNHTRNKGG